MKLSNIILASLVLASLNGMAQDKTKPKVEKKSSVKTEKKKTETPEDKRKAKRDSINKTNTVGKEWNCPPCGMG